MLIITFTIFIYKKDQSVQNECEKIMAQIFCHDLGDIILFALSESIEKCRDCVFRLVAKSQEWEIVKGKIKTDCVEKVF